MKILLINGSPKVKETVSGYLLDELKQKLDVSHDLLECRITRKAARDNVFEHLPSCGAAVFAFPLYVDAVPSHLLHFLTELDQFLQTHPSQAKVYVMVNCGFIEAKQTRLAIRIMECWCRRAGLRWGQAFGVGGGEMTASLSSVPLGTGPKTSQGKAMDKFAECLNLNAEGETLFASPNFPRFAFQMVGNHMWNVEGKANGLSKKALCEQKAPSSF